MNGLWQGTLSRVRGIGITTPGYNPPLLRLAIDGNRVQVFQGDQNGQTLEEVKPGAFTIRRLGSNAVITSIDSSPVVPLGQGWVETWTFALTLRGGYALDVVFTRQVNNMQEDASNPDAIFTIVHSGEMQRVGADHV